MLADRFYPIFENPDWLRRLLPLGIRFVQLRIKNQPEAVLKAEITEAKRLCDFYNCQLVVNDYWQIAIDCGCDFVHLGQEDLDDADLSAIRAANIHIGVSSHDDAELERALETKPAYIALGPVYPTILKKMKWHEQGLECIGQWKKRIGTIPLVGIGGMTPERANSVFEVGQTAFPLSVVMGWTPPDGLDVAEWRC